MAGSIERIYPVVSIGCHCHSSPYLTTVPRLGKGRKCVPTTNAFSTAARSKIWPLLATDS